MKITLVKKIMADGSPCKKCGDVLKKLEESGQMSRIDQVLVADERDENSEGMQLAAKLDVNRAPFFVIEKDDEAPVVYTVYMKFVKEVLEQQTSAEDEAKELMNDNPDLDFI